MFRVKSHFHHRESLDDTRWIAGDDHGNFFLEVHRLFQQSRCVEGFIQILDRVDALHAAPVVAVLAQLVKSGQEVGVFRHIGAGLGQAEFGGGQVIFLVELLLDALVLDFTNHRRLRIHPLAFFHQSRQRVHVYLFYFDGDDIEVFTKIIDRVIIL